MLNISQQLADAVRYEKEGAALVSRVQQQSRRLETLADTSIDNKMRDLGRRTLAMERRLESLRSQNQIALMPTPHHASVAVATSAATPGIGYILRDSSALLIQAAVRGFLVRKVVSLSYLAHTERVYDIVTNRGTRHSTLSLPLHMRQWSHTGHSTMATFETSTDETPSLPTFTIRPPSALTMTFSAPPPSLSHSLVTCPMESLPSTQWRWRGIVQ